MIIVKEMLSGPGPRNIREGLILFSKGLCMGCADIVPGVSGGTVALITGIYSQLLHAISSVNETLVKLVRFELRDAAAALHLRFLVWLLGGIGLAIVGLARLMHFFLEAHPIPTWGMFFGLIAASTLVIGRHIEQWQGKGGIAFVVGALGSFFLVGMIPVSTPETFAFIFFSGMIAICAMILPGISGSFLLLILGKYQFITGAIKNPFQVESLIVIAIFGCGCVVGLLGFSKLLSFLLDRYSNATMAVLTGLMLGSMRKIWPWKEVVDSIVIRDKTHVLSTKNILPPQVDGELFLTLGLAFVGFFLVLVIQKIAGSESEV